MAKVAKIDGGDFEPDPDNKSTIFISHRMEDGEIANVIGDALRDLTQKIELYIAGSCEHRSSKFGTNLRKDIAGILDKTELVLVLYTQEDHDWSWVMWETGVATDPKKPEKTRIVPLSLTGAVPKVLAGENIVRLDDQDSVRNFIKQVCIDNGFFPGMEGPLVDRDLNWTNSRADALFTALDPFVKAETKRRRRCDRFSLSLDAKSAKKLQKSEKLPTKKLMDEIMTAATVVQPSPEVSRHFALSEQGEGTKLATMRECWEYRRKEMELEFAENRAWTSVLIEEIWRICRGTTPRLSWEPFLSVSSNDWLYPLIIEYAFHADGSYDFDVAVVSTLKPGDTVPGE